MKERQNKDTPSLNIGFTKEREPGYKYSTLADRAKFAHDILEFYSKVHKDSVEVPNWNKLTEEERKMEIDLAEEVYHNHRTDVSDAPTVHRLWAFKYVSHGWTYGKKYDAKKKTHPNLVDYIDLVLEERKKVKIYIRALVLANEIFDNDWM